MDEGPAFGLGKGELWRFRAHFHGDNVIVKRILFIFFVVDYSLMHVLCRSLMIGLLNDLFLFLFNDQNIIFILFDLLFLILFLKL